MYSDFIKAAQEIQNFTYTENGALAYKSTGNRVLDAFGSLAAMKDSEVFDILNTFYGAFYEDRRLAMRLLFYVRDIRGGQGMRRVFRVILSSLANKHPEYVINNLDNVLFFGRGDDYLCLLGTSCEDAMISEISKVLAEDITSVRNGGSCSLLAKWLPSENTSSQDTRYLATTIRNKLAFSSKEYRKMLSMLRKEIGIVESKMSQGKWDEINFEKLPSKASMIYSDAFERHCLNNYTEYLSKLASGDCKINAKSLFPVDIIHRVLDKVSLRNTWNGNNDSISIKDKIILDAMWKSLPNYFEGLEETGICCVDTSGSMFGTPVEVALSLGLYCADKCKGPFKDHFFTFDEKPNFQHIVGDTIIDKVASIRSINASNTDFEACLKMILNIAVRNNLKQSDLPTKLYVISDMQFDEARGGYIDSWSGPRHIKTKPFMQKMKEMYEQAGYSLPAIVYWNVRASKCGMFHQTFEGIDCCMVSGYSPSLFKSVIDGTKWEEESVVDKVTGEKKKVLVQKLDPIEVMKTTLNNERYDRVYTG